MLKVTKSFYRNPPNDSEFDPDEPHENPDYEWVVEDVPDGPSDQEVKEFLNSKELQDEIATTLRKAEHDLYEEYFVERNERVIQAFNSVQDALRQYYLYKNSEYYPMSDPREEPDFMRT